MQSTKTACKFSNAKGVRVRNGRCVGDPGLVSSAEVEPDHPGGAKQWAE